MSLLDIQSWWEIPCIAHFCSLFSNTLDLPQFDIEDLEQALLTDSPDAACDIDAAAAVISGARQQVAHERPAPALPAGEQRPNLLPDLIVRLLNGCNGVNRNKVTDSNYQMFLRRLFRQKCEVGSVKKTNKQKN